MSIWGKPGWDFYGGSNHPNTPSTRSQTARGRGSAPKKSPGGSTVGRDSGNAADLECMMLKLHPRRISLENPEPLVHIYRGDITLFEGNAIVNAANCCMLGGGGVDAAIHKGAGPKLRDACEKYKPYRVGRHDKDRCPTGTAKITKGFRLPATWVIHAVGPIYSDRTEEAQRRSEEDLRLAYRNSLALADNVGCKSIAFPAISCGVFGFPIPLGAELALEACYYSIGDIKEVHFVLFEDKVFKAFKEKALWLVSKDVASIVDNSTPPGRNPAKQGTLPATATDADSAPLPASIPRKAGEEADPLDLFAFVKKAAGGGDPVAPAAVAKKAAEGGDPVDPASGAKKAAGGGDPLHPAAVAEGTAGRVGQHSSIMEEAAKGGDRPPPSSEITPAGDKQEHASMAEIAAERGGKALPDQAMAISGATHASFGNAGRVTPGTGGVTMVGGDSTVSYFGGVAATKGGVIKAPRADERVNIDWGSIKRQAPVGEEKVPLSTTQLGQAGGVSSLGQDDGVTSMMEVEDPPSGAMHSSIPAIFEGVQGVGTDTCVREIDPSRTDGERTLTSAAQGEAAQSARPASFMDMDYVPAQPTLVGACEPWGAKTEPQLNDWVDVSKGESSLSPHRQGNPEFKHTPPRL